MFHAQYSATSWEETSRGLKYIYEEVINRGARIDRWGLSLDRVMGLPTELRARAPRETGVQIDTREEWMEIGQVLPIPIHFGDHVVGTPASMSNLTLALETGGTTIGNLAHYFAYDYPGWTDQVARTIDTVKALGAIAALKNRGVVIESNLNDGLGSVFHDMTSTIGWAMLEHYIVEELIGAELVHVFGNVITDARVRLATLLAIDEIHGGETAGPHVNANSIVTEDADRNAAIVGSYLLFDIVGQLRRPTGHAVHPLPLTEHDRVPSPEEVVQAQILAHQMEKEARRAAALVDFRPVEELKGRLIQGGRVFRDRTLEELARRGINPSDPMEMMLALRRIGAWRLEELVGVDAQGGDASHGGGLVPIPSDMYQYALAQSDELVQAVRSQGLSGQLNGQRVLLASTDVHEYGKFVVGVALKEAGAQVVDLGVSVDAHAVAAAAAGRRVGAICISTHNGMALNYAQDLVKEMKRCEVQVPVLMGGKLNQDVDGSLPRDVTTDLRTLGILPENDIAEMIRLLRVDD
jgi:methylmalonyl-CoA mutase cobalamin-binding subunit